ncbi:MAG TPA: cytochrome c oxidase assembly protein [Mycobacteriales bacterium]|nr:cytochrome c oxidase assembly protein [Mycobacteriales bacterium]
MPHMSGELPALSWTTAFTQWRFSPVTTVVVIVLAALYGWGVLRTRRAGVERWPAGPTVAFGAGLLVLVLSMMSSLGVYELELFWIHMIRHLALIMIAPACLAAGRPITLLTRAGSPRVSEITKRVAVSPPVAFLTNPIVGFLIYAAVVVVTHLTGLMNTVMTSSTAAGIEAVAYIVAGYLYFLPVFGDEPIRWWLSYPMRMVVVLLSMPVDTFTGIALMQAHHPMHGMSVRAIYDGGAVMWIGGDFIMVVAILMVFRAWVRSGERVRPEKAGAGWMEAARSQTFRERAGEDIAGDLDEDEAQLAAYNKWLARMNEHDTPAS